MKLTKGQKEAVKKAIDRLFDELSKKLLGRYSSKVTTPLDGSKENKDSLVDLYQYTSHIHSPGMPLDEDVIKEKLDVCDNYLEAQKLKTYNHVINLVNEADDRKDILKLLTVEIKSAENYIEMLVNTEGREIQSVAEKEAVVYSASEVGNEWPMVFWYGKIDGKLCPWCKAMYHRPDNIRIPMVYLFADLKEGYFKPKEWDGVSPYNRCHPNCYDEETEVLTNRGWILFKNVLPNDTFLSVDPVSGDSGWVKHKGLLKLKYTGKMDFFKSHRVNLMTTPDHNHVTISNTNGNLFDLKRGTDLIKSDRLVCTIPNWKGEDKSVVFDGKTYNLKLFAEFMGYWLSEGYLGKASSDTFRIEIAQNKYPIPMISVMEKIFGKSPYYKHNKIVVWVKKSENIELFNFLKGFGKSWEKYVPSFIKEASQEIIKIFLNAYCLGDGSVRLPRGLGTLPTRCFHTSSDKMAADIGELILKIGRKPSYQKSKTRTVKHHNGLYTTKHPCWSISDNKIISSYLKYTPKTQIEYDGFVYDVELEKWHTLFVRRGGKVLLSGNCRHTMFHLPINYGFDAGGNLKYMHYGYNALEEQNKILGKTEHNLQIEELLKHTHDDSCGCGDSVI